MLELTSRAKLPKLAPDTIRRERISGWLADHADVPLRLIAAPSGSGKTTALVSYAAAPLHRAGYVTLDAETTPQSLRAGIARAFAFAPPEDDDALLAAFENAGRCEVLVDEADRAPDAVRATLRRFVYEAPDNVTFVYATRSRDVVDATRLVSLGLGAVLDGDRLAFTAEEATRLAEAARVDAADEREIGRLVHDTEGWAFALSSAIRESASAGRSLDGAFDRWRRSNARFMHRFLDDALAGEDPALATAARKLFDGEHVDEPTLDRLEQRGLFVRWTDGSFRPYRAVARVTRASAPAASPPRALTPFAVRLFGKPDVRIEGQRVAWFRRRDAQIFAFLALQPQGRARRETLVRAFWPDADRQLAAQSLRSACSTMRRSLAAVVGYADLAHYVAFGDEIALNLDLFAIDARRVRAHLRDAETAWASGDVTIAVEHDRAALRLGREELLDGDVPAALAGVALEIDAALSRASTRTAEEADESRRLVAVS
ncbi:MAG: regulatory protein LuxR [Candidatus Eremiobacteraeota bacterium]|nr:regulatory protein LuxR [Candidatus Eremiobacteraeota bacterium]